jgi:hypothetical protein
VSTTGYLSSHSYTVDKGIKLTYLGRYDISVPFSTEMAKQFSIQGSSEERSSEKAAPRQDQKRTVGQSTFDGMETAHMDTGRTKRDL